MNKNELKCSKMKISWQLMLSSFGIVYMMHGYDSLKSACTHGEGMKESFEVCSLISFWTI